MRGQQDNANTHGPYRSETEDVFAGTVIDLGPQEGTKFTTTGPCVLRPVQAVRSWHPSQLTIEKHAFKESVMTLVPEERGNAKEARHNLAVVHLDMGNCLPVTSRSGYFPSCIRDGPCGADRGQKPGLRDVYTFFSNFNRLGNKLRRSDVWPEHEQMKIRRVNKHAKI